MIDSRKNRKAIATFIVAGIAAVIGSRLLEPKVKKALRVR